MFCNEGGRCVREKKIGERCTQNEACGRKAMCIFETTLSTYGTCKEILSQSDEMLVLPMYKADMAEVDSNIFVYQSDFEKVCRSGFLNVTSGRCATGLKSKNKVKKKALNKLFREKSVLPTQIVQQQIPRDLLNANAVTMTKATSIATQKEVTRNGLMLLRR